jgi:hypothetical protein
MSLSRAAVMQMQQRGLFALKIPKRVGSESPDIREQPGGHRG